MPNPNAGIVFRRHPLDADIQKTKENKREQSTESKNHTNIPEEIKPSRQVETPIRDINAPMFICKTIIFFRAH